MGLAIPILGAVGGAIQSIVGAGKARKYGRQLNQLVENSPHYDPNQSIMDYYNTALQRYNVNPTDTALYKRNMQNINRGLATGISSLQDRRSALGGISSLLRASNDASLNAEVAAEQQRNQRFGELGSASQLKAGEEAKAFEQNKMLPYNLKYNLLSQRAGAANNLVNTGLSNIFGNLQNIGSMKQLKKAYGTGNLGSMLGSSGG